MNYQPMTKREEKELLSASKISSFNELIKIIPKKFILEKKLGIGNPISEMEIDKQLSLISQMNINNHISFLGQGIYDHYVPKSIDFISARSEFYTAYTPYQPEVSQGTLQYIYEYQSMICELSGMDIANASLYDGASALFEACMMANSITKKNTILYSKSLYVNNINVMHTCLSGTKIKLKEIPCKNGFVDTDYIKNYNKNDLAAIIIQSPNTFGLIEDLSKIKSDLGELKTLFIVSSNPLFLSVLKKPSDCGADIYVGEGQSLGNYMNFGGPLLGIIAVKESYKRTIPGRIVGKTIDKEGKTGYVLTLQTREQHIRREKATSNICTNQGLLALRSVIYMSLMGKHGLPYIVKLSYQKAQYAAEQINKLKNYNIKFNNQFINEFAVSTKYDINDLYYHCIDNGIIIDIQNLKDDFFMIAITEKRTKDEIDKLISCLKKYK